MGYKVNESSLANSLNFRYAMWKGIPIQLLAVSGGGTYDPDYGTRYNYKLYGRKIGQSNDKFKIDPMEPTLSADACQGGYCFNENGKELAFLNIVNGQPTCVWTTSNSNWSSPGYETKQLYNCVMGISPTFEEAHDAVTKLVGRKKACHFDRDFALVREHGFTDISLHYRGKSIGTYDPKTRRITLRKGPTIKLLKRKLDRLTKEKADG